MWRSPSIGDSSIIMVLYRNLWLFWPLTLSILCGNWSFNDSDKLWRVPQNIIPLSRSGFWLLVLVFKSVWNCQDHMRCFSKDRKHLDCHFCRPHEVLSSVCLYLRWRSRISVEPINKATKKQEKLTFIVEFCA
jgi:hypothetical protein